MAGKGGKKMPVPIIQLHDRVPIAGTQLAADFLPQVVIHMFRMLFHKRLREPLPSELYPPAARQWNPVYGQLYRLIKGLT
jgi:hypothetical protein